MYRDLKRSPFNQGPRASVNPYRNEGQSYDSRKVVYDDIDPEVRYGFTPSKNYIPDDDSRFEFQSFEGRQPEDRKPEKQFKTLKYYNDEHFLHHEEECEVCDYIELFQNIDRQQFKEMFAFSEVIAKPKALRRRY